MKHSLFRWLSGLSLVLFWGPMVMAQEWALDLTPIENAEWTPARAAHLLERAGFGGTPEEIAHLAAMTPEQAVAYVVRFEGAPVAALPPFDHSGVFEAGLDPFPPSRPAVTDAAKDAGQALGITVKPDGNRRAQAIVNQFFYWLRASRLETGRVAYWWANRMLASPRPLQEKMALFWHGHFATSEDKVRDYRKMLMQIELLQREGLGNFGDLLHAVAKDPAMLAFLDAGVNVKGAPNENFAREIMELFTLGVGHYSETDIREAARAFTGWNFVGTQYQFNKAAHDAGRKTVLGRTGNLTGEAVIDIILEQEATAQHIAGRLYHFFVRDRLDPGLQAELGRVLKSNRYELEPFLEVMFRSRDFYAPQSVGTHVRSPVELVISSYRKLGLKEVPGVPDFNVVTSALGQNVLFPPTVAGWSGGRSWVTPGLLFERGNFVLDVMFPDVAFVPPDRYPGYSAEIIEVQNRLRAGLDITRATTPAGVEAGGMDMAASNRLADRDEDFNTRYGSFRGWQMALERVQPIPRRVARLDLTAMVLASGARTPREVVDSLAGRFFAVPLEADTLTRLAKFLESELGTADVKAAETFMEEPLRQLLHAMLSLPEYQLG
jgi:Protein of unknown function (DUF1800)